MLRETLHLKQEKRTNLGAVFKNESGAIDLASIMVGILVIGVIGGVISATVFAVIPWAQDNGAKAQMDSVVSAQSAYMGLSSAVPPAVPAGHPANSYASSAQLEEAGLLKRGGKHCTISTDAGKGYTAYTRSDSGKIWTASDKKTSSAIFTSALPAECQFLAEGATGPTGSDIDGDGIPNDQDRDANGDGIQDGYIPGGPIAVLDGTSYPTTGTYFSTVLTAGGTTITSNVSHSSAPSSRKVAVHFIVTCVKDDGSFYKRNFLNGYTAPTSSYNTNLNTVPCAAGERVDEYTVKPVTQEAMASGQISNPEFFGGWTFAFNGAPGGVRWSEPDGYPTHGNFQSANLVGGGSTLYATVQNASGTATTLGFQYKATCEKADRSTYSVNRLASYTSRAGYIENTLFALTPCGTDRVTAYEIAPVTKLGEVENRTAFAGYTITGGKSWKEADGYPTHGSFQSAYLAGGGSTLNVTVQNASGVATPISFQYITTCERADRTTYSVNRIAGYTSRAGYIENTLFSLTPCGTDRVTAYEIFPLNKLGDAESRTIFGGYTITGGKSWSESDGYPTHGSFQSAYLAGGGSTLYVTVQNASGVATPISFQYTSTCERSDKTIYSVNKIAGYTSRAGYIENTLFGLAPCGTTDRVTAYQIFPVNKLGDAESRTVFGGYTITGTNSWSEADGYRTHGSFQSAYLTGGGSTLNVTVQNASGTATPISFQYITTCERSDRTTYSVNRIAGYTSRAGIIENTLFSLTPCGTDRVLTYDIFAVNKLGDAESRTIFGGYTITGGKSWSESDGYLMSGNFQSSYITGTTLYVTFRNETGTAMTLATNYTMTCERADLSTYSVNRIAAYTSRANVIENTMFAFTNCGTDKIKAYTIAPVTKLGDVENRSAFAGYSLKGSYSWIS